MSGTMYSWSWLAESVPLGPPKGGTTNMPTPAPQLLTRASGEKGNRRGRRFAISPSQSVPWKRLNRRDSAACGACASDRGGNAVQRPRQSRQATRSGFSGSSCDSFNPEPTATAEKRGLLCRDPRAGAPSGLNDQNRTFAAMPGRADFFHRACCIANSGGYNNGFIQPQCPQEVFLPRPRGAGS